MIRVIVKFVDVCYKCKVISDEHIVLFPDVTKLLLFAAQAAHEKVPPEVSPLRFVLYSTLVSIAIQSSVQ